MKKILFTCLILCSYQLAVSAQDLSSFRVGLIRYDGNIEQDILNSLDKLELVTDAEKELVRRLDRRLQKWYQDEVFEILLKQLDGRGIELLPLEETAKLTRLNERGYPNPLTPKKPIKKKNNNIGDYFLNITINCSKPLIGGLLGFRPTSSIRIVLHDASGEKLKTINETVKAQQPLKPADFDEPWSIVIEQFDKMDWHHRDMLIGYLLPLVEEAVKVGLDALGR
ncbi:MAG: hypothetical protein KTR30_27335 [Saprospiraceae bacterium]|nr:hypothetical protein [Saprospiraceae bacterium]